MAVMEERDRIINSNNLFKQFQVSTGFSGLETLLNAEIGAFSYIASVTGTDDAPTSANRWVVIGSKNANGYYAFQVTFTFDNKLFKRYRFNSDTWSGWVSITPS